MSQFVVRGKSSRGFTLVELMVVIAIVIILLALLIPTVSNTMARRRQTECANRLKQIDVARRRAQGDGEQILSNNWTTVVANYVGAKGDVLLCPDDIETEQSASYAMNNRVHRFDDRDGSRIVMLDYRQTEANLVVREAADQDDWTADAGLYAARHLEGINTLLHTGAVKTYRPEDIDPRDCDLYKQFWRPHQDKQFELDECLEEEEDTSEPTTNPPPPEEEVDPNEYRNEDPALCDRDNMEPLVIDNQDSGFETVYDSANDTVVIEIFGWKIEETQSGRGDWHDGSNRIWMAFNDGNTSIAPSYQTPGTQAVYTFNVNPGNKYRVWAFWPGENDYETGQEKSHCTSTPIRVFDGDEEIYSETVDQSQRPEGGAASTFPSSIGTRVYQQIGEEHLISSSTMKVVISADGGDDFDPVDLRYVVADVIRVDCAQRTYNADQCEDHEPPAVDDGSATATAGFTEQGNEDAVGGSHRKASAGSGNETVTYEFSGLRTGQYDLWAHFTPASGQATNTPVTVYDGEHQFGTLTMNQSVQYSGSDLDDDGRLWLKVGSYEVTTDNVRVVLSNSANGIVIADAMRVMCAFSSYENGCDDLGDVYGRECRKDYSEEYEGDEETQEAVARAFSWLSKHQLSDGSWSFNHHLGSGDYVLDTPDQCNGRCGGKGSYDKSTVAATGISVLPFLGAGYGPEHDVYGDCVAAGIQFLMDNMTKDGLFIDQQRGWKTGYPQGMALLGLVEALGICRQSGFGSIDQTELTSSVHQAIKFSLSCQDQYQGGWKYPCGSSADMTVTAWFIQAMITARELGIDVEGIDKSYSTFGGMETWLNHMSYDSIPDNVHGTYASRYGYSFLGGAMWNACFHVGPYLRLAMGVPPEAAAMQVAAEGQYNLWGASGPIGSDVYRHTYSHHFMRLMGGDHWTRWEAEIIPYYKDEQNLDEEDHKYGSWYIGSPQVSNETGRLLATVFITLCFEDYYRYASPF